MILNIKVKNGNEWIQVKDKDLIIECDSKYYTADFPPMEITGIKISNAVPDDNCRHLGCKQ